GRIAHPAEGIDPHVFDESLFGSGDTSARQLLLRELGPERGVRVIARYDAFLDGVPLDDAGDEYGLTTRDYLAGATDGHAVRSRAEIVKSLALEHFRGGASTGGTSHAGTDHEPLRLASLACGLAQPMLELAGAFAETGARVSEIVFVDHDPMALAMVRSLARGAAAAPAVRAIRRNFLVHPLAHAVGHGGADLVDLVGAFEHLPTSHAGYRVAAAVLAEAADAVRPGGLLIVGNMLRERPQQHFFDAVWPSLHQRSITEMLGLIADAGLSVDQTRVRVSAREGIYAVYAIRVPESRGRAVRDEGAQRMLARLFRARAAAS
ncbi:MAG: hypothetical protein ACTH31_07935, partial [Pseudoclavibacter sp.]